MIFHFDHLPEWLTLDQELDWVQDSASVSGTIPVEIDTFSFAIRVEDEEGLVDSVHVQGEAVPYTVLSDTLSGTLALEDSPFLVTDNLYVLAGEILTIEPGCSLLFRSVNDVELKTGIYVSGLLEACGTVTDSIYFLDEPVDEGDYNPTWKGIFLDSEADTSIFDYVYLTHAYYGISNLNGTVTEISRSVFHDNYHGSHNMFDAYTMIDSCLFLNDWGQSLDQIFIYQASMQLTNSTLLNRHPEFKPYAIDVLESSSLEMENCLIENTEYLWLDRNSELIAKHNHFKNMATLGIRIMNRSYGLISNNLFEGTQIYNSLWLNNFAQMHVINNVFLNSRYGIHIRNYYQLWHPFYIYNNVFVNTDTAIFVEDPYLIEEGYNCFYDNRVDVTGLELDETDIFTVPYFENYEDFRLADNSLLIDAGHPNGRYEDVDDSRNDIGILGGPDGESYDYPGLITMTIDLQGNYFELISPWLYPATFDIANLFDPVDELVIIYEDMGDILIPDHVNTIEEIQPDRGYYVFCGEPSTWTVQGSMIDPNTVYEIAGGRWNWIGYPFDVPSPVEDALQEIEHDILIMLSDDGGIWLPGENPPVNTLGDMLPGEGFMVFAWDDLTFQYQSPAIFPGRLVSNDTHPNPRLDTLPNRIKPTGKPNLVMVNLDDNLRLSAGEIVIYDGTRIVGSSKVMKDRETTPVICWEGSSEYGLAGFESGHAVRIVVTDRDGAVIIDKTSKKSSGSCPGQTFILREMVKPFHSSS